MAVGDKKPVVMESDVGAAGGVAAYDATQAALADKVDKYGKGVNLLDNWYFVGGGSQQGGGQFPINQRGGYVVPPGTYTWKSADPSDNRYTDSYYTVDGFFSDGNARIWIDEVEYAVDNQTPDDGNVVRGYTGAGYGIDRWRLSSDKITALVQNDGIRLIESGSTDSARPWIQYIFEKKDVFSGKKITLSASVSCNVAGTFRIVFRDRIGSTLYYRTKDFELAAGRTTVCHYTWTINDALEFIALQLMSDNVDVVLSAVKLELGVQQTLAHYDETTQEWVLNDPPPNYQQELAKCQRYYLPVTQARISGAWVDQVVVLSVPTPVTMRAIPTPIVNSVGVIATPSMLKIPISITVNAAQSNSVTMHAATSDTAASGDYVVVLADAKFALSADL